MRKEEARQQLTRQMAKLSADLSLDLQEVLAQIEVETTKPLAVQLRDLNLYMNTKENASSTWYKSQTGARTGQTDDSDEDSGAMFDYNFSVPSRVEMSDTGDEDILHFLSKPHDQRQHQTAHLSLEEANEQPEESFERIAEEFDSMRHDPPRENSRRYPEVFETHPALRKYLERFTSKSKQKAYKWCRTPPEGRYGRHFQRILDTDRESSEGGVYKVLPSDLSPHLQEILSQRGGAQGTAQGEIQAFASLEMQKITLADAAILTALQTR